MKKNKLALVTIMTLLATTSLVGCNKSSEVTTITFLNGKSEVVDWIDKKIVDFEKDNPTIKVNHVFDKDASSALKVDINAGDIPDITTVYETTLIKQGYYYDMSSLSAWSRVSASAKELCTNATDGKIYRLATNRANAGLFYNKAIFAECNITSEPATWDDFTADLQKVVAKGYKGLYMGGNANSTWMLGHLMEFWGHGIIKEKLGNVEANKAFLTNDSTKLNFTGDNSPIVSFGTKFLELKTKGLINDNLLTASSDDQTDNFATGKAAVISNGMWCLSGILTKNSTMASNIGFMPYPSMDSTLAPKAVILSDVDSGYSIMNASVHKDAAIKFLDYLWGKDNQVEYAKLVSSPSSFTDVDADYSPIKAAVSNALEKGFSIGFTPTPSGFGGGECETLIQGLYSGDYTPTTFATEYAKQWNSAYTAANK
jgi:raffinose/stachyose/melibiose transport system substrate-binding protein